MKDPAEIFLRGKAASPGNFLDAVVRSQQQALGLFQPDLGNQLNQGDAPALFGDAAGIRFADVRRPDNITNRDAPPEICPDILLNALLRRQFLRAHFCQVEQQGFDIVLEQCVVFIRAVVFPVDAGKQPEQSSLAIRDAKRLGQDEIRLQHKAVELLAAAPVDILLVIHPGGIGQNITGGNADALLGRLDGGRPFDEQIQQFNFFMLMPLFDPSGIFLMMRRTRHAKAGALNFRRQRLFHRFFSFLRTAHFFWYHINKYIIFSLWHNAFLWAQRKNGSGNSGAMRRP